MRVFSSACEEAFYAKLPGFESGFSEGRMA